MNDPLAPVRSLPRLRLARLPTPLEPMPRLGAALGIRSLWAKRDDCTGLGLGGNKVRKLEFSLASAQAAGANCVVCGGVVQSNAARQVAAACAKIGIECHLGIMHGRLRTMESGYASTGNILLDRLYGAVLHDIPWGEDRNARLEALASDLRAAGKRVFMVPYGASDALGAMGYALAAEEIIRDCPEVAWIVHSSGSGGTQAGLLAGVLALGHRARVIGVDVDAQAGRVKEDVQRIGFDAAALLGITGRWENDKVEVVDDWCGPGYGETDASTEEAIVLAARLEGLLVDPVYSGKGMAGLIGLARQRRFDDGAVVWIHTGGSPSIFAYPTTMVRLSEVATRLAAVANRG